MVDYTENGRTRPDKEKPEDKPPKITKIVKGEVVQRKKPLGRRLKDMFVGGDTKSLAAYVVTTVIVPAARDMIVDAATQGVQRMMYGEDRNRRTTSGSALGSRFSYNAISNDSSPRLASRNQGSGRIRREAQDEIILVSRDEADYVLENMVNIVEAYEVVSLHDLKSMLGLNPPHVDNRWGWTSLVGTEIRQVREGWLLDLPRPEPI